MARSSEQEEFPQDCSVTNSDARNGGPDSQRTNVAFQDYVISTD